MKIITVDVHRKRLLIAPFGDIQYTGEKNPGGCSARALKSYLAEITRQAKINEAQLAWVGTGDYVDLLSPSNRSLYRASGLYSSARRLISTSMAEIVEELGKILGAYMRPKDIVAMCVGHHYFVYDKDDNEGEYIPWTHSDQHLASLLGLAKRDQHGLVPGLGCGIFKWANKNVYRILFEHGQGNGQSIAYGLNKLDKIAGGWEGIDAHIMGHVHKVGITKKARLHVVPDGVEHRDIHLLTSGTFLKGFATGEVLYPEMKQLAPLALGSAALLVSEDESVPAGFSAVGLTL